MPYPVVALSSSRRTARGLAFLALSAVVVAPPVSAQATILGRVQTASGVAIELVEVTVLEGARSAVSATDGSFRIVNVSLGGVMIRTRRMGFGVVTISAQLDSAGDRAGVHQNLCDRATASVCLCVVARRPHAWL